MDPTQGNFSRLQVAEGLEARQDEESHALVHDRMQSDWTLEYSGNQS